MVKFWFSCVSIYTFYYMVFIKLNNVWISNLLIVKLPFYFGSADFGVVSYQLDIFSVVWQPLILRLVLEATLWLFTCISLFAICMHLSASFFFMLTRLCIHFFDGVNFLLPGLFSLFFFLELSVNCVDHGLCVQEIVWMQSIR